MGGVEGGRDGARGVRRREGRGGRGGGERKHGGERETREKTSSLEREDEGWS